MDNDVKAIAIICLTVLIFFISIFFYDYKKDELKKKQPKYLIEIKNEMYELRKLEVVEK